MSLYAVEKYRQLFLQMAQLYKYSVVDRGMRTCTSSRRRQYRIPDASCQTVSIEGIFIPSKIAQSPDISETSSTQRRRALPPMIKEYIPVKSRISKALYVRNWTWYAKTDTPGKPPSAPGPVRRSGGGIGRLDAASEAGLFHKKNKSRLEEIKARLKAKNLMKDDEEDPLKPVQK